jgi:hypothetical protein
VKAIGYVRCLECDGLYRGYPPRGWKPGDELATWRHTWEDGSMLRCPGSFKVGHDTHLDSEWAAKVPTS